MIIPVFLIYFQTGCGAINACVVNKDVDMAEFRFNSGDTCTDLIEVANIYID
jgi:hypothetical protein